MLRKRCEDDIVRAFRKMAKDIDEKRRSSNTSDQKITKYYNNYHYYPKHSLSK